MYSIREGCGNKNPKYVINTVSCTRISVGMPKKFKNSKYILTCKFNMIVYVVIKDHRNSS